MRKLITFIVLSILISGILTDCKINNFDKFKSYGEVSYILEAPTAELIQSIAENNYSDIDLQIVLDDVSKSNSGADYISSFYDAWQKHYPNIRLWGVFSTIETKDLIRPSSTDEEVLEVLRNMRKEAFDKIIEILTKRIEKFGIKDYDISRLNGDLIKVKLPLIKDSLRLKGIIQNNAYVEFWETFNFTNPKIYESIFAADSASYSIKRDTTEGEGRLLSYLRPNFYLETEGSYYPRKGPVIGFALIKDTAAVNALFRKPEIISLCPRNMKLLWGFTSPKYNSDTSIRLLELYAIKLTRRDGKPLLSSDYIQKASAYFKDDNSEIRLHFDAEGTRIWKNVTRQNISGNIAITINREVYLAPMVLSEISSGKARITANFTSQEASDLSIIISFGKLPLSVRIVNTEYKK